MTGMPTSTLRSLAARVCAPARFTCASSGGVGQPREPQAGLAEEAYTRGDFRAAADAFLAWRSVRSPDARITACAPPRSARRATWGQSRGCWATSSASGSRRAALRYDLLDAGAPSPTAMRRVRWRCWPCPEARLPAGLATRRLELTARAQAARRCLRRRAHTRHRSTARLDGADRAQNRHAASSTVWRPARRVTGRSWQSCAPNSALRPWIEQALRKQGNGPAGRAASDPPVGTHRQTDGRWTGYRETRRVVCCCRCRPQGRLRRATIACFDQRGGATRGRARLRQRRRGNAGGLPARRGTAPTAWLAHMTREGGGCAVCAGHLPVRCWPLSQPSGAPRRHRPAAFGLARYWKAPGRQAHGRPGHQGETRSRLRRHRGLGRARQPWPSAPSSRPGGKVVGEARLRGRRSNSPPRHPAGPWAASPAGDRCSSACGHGKPACCRSSS